MTSLGVTANIWTDRFQKQMFYAKIKALLIFNVTDCAGALIFPFD